MKMICRTFTSVAAVNIFAASPVTAQAIELATDISQEVDAIQEKVVPGAVTTGVATGVGSLVWGS